MAQVPLFFFYTKRSIIINENNTNSKITCTAEYRHTLTQRHAYTAEYRHTITQRHAYTAEYRHSHTTACLHSRIPTHSHTTACLHSRIPTHSHTTACLHIIRIDIQNIKKHECLVVESAFNTSPQHSSTRREKCSQKSYLSRRLLDMWQNELAHQETEVTPDVGDVCHPFPLDVPPVPVQDHHVYAGYVETTCTDPGPHTNQRRDTSDKLPPHQNITQLA